MVFGHPGQDGLHVANHVVEEHQQGQDPAVVQAVVEILVPERTMKTKLAINNAVVS